MRSYQSCGRSKSWQTARGTVNWINNGPLSGAEAPCLVYLRFLWLAICFEGIIGNILHDNNKDAENPRKIKNTYFFISNSIFDPLSLSNSFELQIGNFA